MAPIAYKLFIKSDGHLDHEKGQKLGLNMMADLYDKKSSLATSSLKTNPFLDWQGI
jgi:hypothetical protein